jgi:hypothetical protein
MQFDCSNRPSTGHIVYTCEQFEMFYNDSCSYLMEFAKVLYRLQNKHNISTLSGKIQYIDFHWETGESSWL